MAVGGWEARLDRTDKRVDDLAERTAAGVAGVTATVASTDRQLAEIRKTVDTLQATSAEAIVTAQEARKAAADALEAAKRCAELTGKDPLVGELFRAEYQARLDREKMASTNRTAIWARLTDSGLWAHVPAWIGIVTLVLWQTFGGKVPTSIPLREAPHEETTPR